MALLAAFGWHCATHAIDFPLYHAAGAKVLAGDFALYPAELTDGSGTVTGHSFRYAPIFALLFAPLALLPLPAAALILYGLKLLGCAYIFRVISRRLPSPAPVRRVVLLAVLVTGGYLVEEFRNGNLHFLIAVLMVLAFDQAQRGRVALSACSLAFAILAKVVPGLLLAYFVFRRQFTVAIATVAATVLLLLVPSVVMGWETNARLTGTFFRYAAMKADEQANHSLRGALRRYLTVNTADDPRNPDWNVASLDPRTVDALWLIVVAAAAIGALITFRQAPRDDEQALIELALLFLVMLLVSPHSQRIYYSTLLVPAAVGLTVLYRNPGAPGAGLLRAGLMVVGITGSLMPFLLGTRRLAVAFEALSPHVLALLFFTASLVVMHGRGRRPAYAPSPTHPGTIASRPAG